MNHANGFSCCQDYQSGLSMRVATVPVAPPYPFAPKSPLPAKRALRACKMAWRGGQIVWVPPQSKVLALR